MVGNAIWEGNAPKKIDRSLDHCLALEQTSKQTAWISVKTVELLLADYSKHEPHSDCIVHLKPEVKED